MTRITESAIKQLAIGRLEALGYRYVYAPDLAPVPQVWVHRSLPCFRNS